MFCKNCGKNIDKGTRFCKHCGAEKPRQEAFYHHIFSWLKEYKWVFIILGVIAIVISIIGADDNSSSTYSNQTSSYTPSYNNNYVQPVQKTTPTQADQNKIAPLVANILCTDGTESGSAGGSGTIMTSGGLILTNAHIIPQDSNEQPTIERCVVSLPDAKGQAKEIYYGEPIVIPYLSKLYDLAFVQIKKAYVDDDGVAHGQYPKDFGGFMDTICENDDVTLGEAVRVFGYPEISGGGYYLTVTDGVVSSLPNDGTIVTSAKIDHGNSGGIAVDENGCFIGVPSMARTGTIESLGIIISNEVIFDFMTKLNTLIDEVNQSKN